MRHKHYIMCLCRQYTTTSSVAQNSVDNHISGPPACVSPSVFLMVGLSRTMKDQASPTNTRFVRSYADPSAVATGELPQVAFLGRSNAGKSSLLNSISATANLARVSATPGRTRLINVFDVGGKYQLVDLPGYGFATGSKAEREKLAELIHGYLSTALLLRLAIVILDSRIGPTDTDRDMIESLHISEIPFVLVLTKTDKLSRTQVTQALDSVRALYPDVRSIAYSSMTGTGRGELLDIINQTVRTKPTSQD